MKAVACFSFTRWFQNFLVKVNASRSINNVYPKAERQEI